MPLNILVYLSAVLVFPITLLVLACLWVYRQLVDLYLAGQFGDQYGGLLGGTDLFWTMETKTRNIISTVSLVSATHFNPKQFADQVRDSLYSRNIDKLLAVRHHCLGTVCLIRNRCKWEDIVEFFAIDENCGQEGLEELISNHCNKPMPCDNRGLWQIHIANNPIRLRGTLVYPVYFRFHHSLGDGPSLLYMTTQLLNANVNLNIPEPVPQPPPTILGHLKCLAIQTYFILISLPLYLTEFRLNADDPHLLHGTPLSGDKWAVYHVEDQPKLVNKVKELKRKHKGTLFENFLMLATTQATLEYIKKRNGHIPDVMSAVLPVPMPEKDFNLTNTVSMCKIFLPTKSDNPLEMISRQTQSLRNTPTVATYYYLITTISEVSVSPITKFLTNNMPLTMCMSSLPGATKFNFFGDNDVEDMLFWVPNRDNVGICFSFLTYDGRFQIGLLVDKALIPQREDARSIVDDIAVKLDKMHKELLK